MSLLYPHGLSTHTSFKANKFYTTSFKPISNYSSGCSQFYQNNKSIVNSYMENYIKDVFQTLEDLGYIDLFYAYDIVNDIGFCLLSFTAPDFGRRKRHDSLQNPCACCRRLIVSEIFYFAYDKKTY